MQGLHALYTVDALIMKKYYVLMELFLYFIAGFLLIISFFLSVKLYNTHPVFTSHTHSLMLSHASDIKATTDLLMLCAC